MTTYGAEWSEHRFYKRDPLPEIAPALLNSEDIRQYVKKGCLLEEDSFDSGRMKLASYQMRFLGTLYDWVSKDGTLERRCRKVVKDQHIELSRNSISYLWLEERLRLPEYIAARFNLRISAVHRGILLGTGPLIDPGFGGRLLIPLHNLTDKDYHFCGGEGIIWIEFTKISQTERCLSSGKESERQSELADFLSEKAIDNPNSYFKRAGAVGVQSAFKGALDAAREAAKKADRQAQELDKRTRNLSFVGVLTLVAGIAALVLSALVLALTAMMLVFSAYDIRGRVTEWMDEQGERIQRLEMALEQRNEDSNASGVAQEAEVSEPANLEEEGAVSSEGGTESEGDGPRASSRGIRPERWEPPAPRVRQ